MFNSRGRLLVRLKKIFALKSSFSLPEGSKWPWTPVGSREDDLWEKNSLWEFKHISITQSTCQPYKEGRVPHLRPSLGQEGRSLNFSFDEQRKPHGHWLSFHPQLSILLLEIITITVIIPSIIVSVYLCIYKYMYKCIFSTSKTTSQTASHLYQPIPPLFILTWHSVFFFFLCVQPVLKSYSAFYCGALHGLL